MSIYSVIRKTDQVEVSRYGAFTAIYDDFPAPLYDHVEVDPGAVVEPPPPASIKITKLAFRNRFTAAEKAGIEFASLDNPAATMPARLMAASLRANQADINAAAHIDLMRPDTRGGVEALEYFGLIAVGRADVILDTPPAEQEVWNG